MEPAGQTSHPVLFDSAPDREGVHAPDRSAPAAARARPAREERRANQEGRSPQPRPPRETVCGAQQAPQRQPRCSGVSENIFSFFCLREGGVEWCDGLLCRILKRRK